MTTMSKRMRIALLTHHPTVDPHIQPQGPTANLQGDIFPEDASFLIYPAELANMNGNTAADGLNYKN